ncbi:MAG: anthranilate synthase component I family protein [Clostridiales bacterium]|jgi:anthranilate synthase component 1|nr:anthranilate synthase component I family protein [Clostridiales bacterium]
MTFDELKSLAGGYRAAPIFCEIPANGRTPADVFMILKKLSRHCYILESADSADRRGRYSFLGYDPKLEVSCADGELKIKNGAEIRIRTDDPGAHIRGVLEDNRSPRVPGLPPFTGGLVGYFSYDYVKYGEPALKLDAPDEDGFKDVDLMLFDKVVVFDHLKNVIVLIVSIRTDALEENYNRGLIELDTLRRVVENGSPARFQPLTLKSPFRQLFDKQRYCEMVERAKVYICEGDIFQAVLSNRLDADADGSLFDTYKILRKSNPSPYMFYFSSDDIEVAGAAPETLVKLQNGAVFTFPLAGTRPRGKTPGEDEALAQGLLADPKELAEHNMLVDLGRNDIGKISRFGSVRVEKYMTVERFSHVMHIGSTVVGGINPGLSGVDAVNALLPAGTLSGAPKLRACEIINELEQCKRGIYGGAIGYLATSGDMDTCIAIRIAFKKNGRVFLRSGAGIVADSVPEREYEECANKLRAVVDALERASEGQWDDPAYR